jgi:hypothetical protein
MLGVEVVTRTVKFGENAENWYSHNLSLASMTKIGICVKASFANLENLVSVG